MDIQYFNPASQTWENTPSVMTCGNSGHLAKVKPYSYTRSNFHYIPNEEEEKLNSKVRFKIGTSDSILYSEVVEINIDPDHFKSEVEQEIMFIDRFLSNEKTTEQDKLNLLNHKATILAQDNQLISALRLYAEIEEGYKMTDKVIFRYVLYLTRYSKDKTDDEKHIVTSKLNKHHHHRSNKIWVSPNYFSQ